MNVLVCVSRCSYVPISRKIPGPRLCLWSPRRSWQVVFFSGVCENTHTFPQCGRVLVVSGPHQHMHFLSSLFQPLWWVWPSGVLLTVSILPDMRPCPAFCTYSKKFANKKKWWNDCDLGTLDSCKNYQQERLEPSCRITDGWMPSYWDNMVMHLSTSFPPLIIIFYPMACHSFKLKPWNTNSLREGF